MPVAVRNVDETDAILAVISDNLHNCTSTAHVLEDTAGSLLDAITDCDDSITLPYGPFSNAMQAEQDLGVAAAARTHDLELCIGERRFAHFAGDLGLSPFNIEDKNYSVSATPLGNPIFSWRTGPLGRARPGCFLVESTWRTIVSGGNERVVHIRTEVGLKVDRDTPHLSLFQAAAPRFLADDGSAIDPLEMVPIDDRGVVRRKLYDQVQSLTSQHHIPFPALGAGELQFQVNPHFYFITWDLTFVCRTLPKRRKSYLLAPLLYGGYNQMIRLKSDHVLPLIHKKIADLGGQLTSVAFNRGYAHLAVRKTQSDSFLWVSCDATVDIEYDLTFRQTLPGLLEIHAVWTRWQGHYEAHLCVPVCDDVLKIAREEAAKQVEQYKTLDFDFADLSAQATAASGVIELYGIHILMKGR